MSYSYRTPVKRRRKASFWGAAATFLGFVGLFLLVVALSAASTLLTAWILMLIGGAVCKAVGWHTLGYWIWVAITIGLGIVASFFKGSSKNP